MNWLWLNISLMVVFFLAIAGIPLWVTFRHPDSAPVRAPRERHALRLAPAEQTARARRDERSGELAGAWR